MLTEVRVMPIRPRPDFGKVIARAAIERRDLANEAKISKRAIDRLAKPENYSAGEGSADRGTTREVTAWKIAHAFARLTNKTADEAFKLLFVEVAE